MEFELKLATVEQVQTFQKKAKDWFNQDKTKLFGDISVRARTATAIIEFLANQEGLTCYTIRVGHKYIKV